MRREKYMDMVGIVSQIGLWLCFGLALWAEATGAAELKRIAGVCAAAFFSTAALAIVVYLGQIARNRRAARKRQGA
ncbi:MAG TPA: hypothetical protein VEZ72_11730 [Paenibacillus sp.]|nr:hypothetical protein [Paenibacillus sp.]